jgi:protein-disulfide isomerase
MFSKNNILFMAIGGLIVVGIGAVILGFTGLGKGTASVKDTATPPSGQDTVKAKEISVDDDPYIGSADAPVTIVEFSDFQCPFCAGFYSSTFPQLKQDYIDTGKVKLVYRDFPLSNIHQYAEKAAEAANCAQEQGKYWEYSDILFKNQSDWNTVGVSKFKDYAAQLGLNQDQFNSCLDSGSMAQEIQNDFNQGMNYGVSGTPSFFVNGDLVVGAQPFSVFQQKIDSLLK